MKRFSCILLSLCLSSVLFAQEESGDVPAATRSGGELEKLVAPIALYPDSLIALILPASTTSADIVLAARFIAADGDVAKGDGEPWSDSVRSLVHFPVVVKWLDENLAWTRQLGDVFLVQPAEVMNAIQRVRAKAKADGLLADTAEQRVVIQDDHICIVPVRAEIIYVPCYDPEMLWMRRTFYGRSFVTFGAGFAVGNWLYYDCDWPRRTIWIHRRSPGWVYRPAWHRPVGSAPVVTGAPWTPPHHARSSYHARTSHRPDAPVASTRVPVDVSGHRPRPPDSHPRGVHPDPQPHVWQNKDRPVPSSGQGSLARAGRVTSTPPPAIQTPPAPVSAMQPVPGRHYDQRGGDGRPSPSSGSSYSRASRGSMSSSPHTRSEANAMFAPASRVAREASQTIAAPPPPAMPSGHTGDVGRGQKCAGR